MKNRKKGSAVIMLLLIAYLLLPLIVTIVYSLFEKWTDIMPRGFSVKSYVELFQDPEFLMCILRSLVVCVVPIVLTTVIILLAMFVTTLYFPRLDKYVQIICMIPYTIQGVILSVSILAAYVQSETFLSNRMVMLFGAYSVIIMPYIYQGIKNGMAAVNVPTLVEAAEMLGCSRIYAFFKVVVPNLISSVVVSSLLAVGIIFGDYVLVRNLTGTSFQNMQIYLYQTMKSDSMKASAVFVVIMGITFIIAAVTLHLKNRGRRTTR